MKRLVLCLLLAFGFAASSITVNAAGAGGPCSGGVSVVHSQMWIWNNTTWFTMCSCNEKKGNSASGSCTAPGGVGGI